MQHGESLTHGKQVHRHVPSHVDPTQPHYAQERSPLLTHTSIEEGPSSSLQELLPQDQQFHTPSGATVTETMTNLAKTCMGTGCLALPFAAKQGGILLHVFGLLVIALWNVLASQRLSACWDLLLSKTLTLPPPPRGTATLGKVAWYALGGSTGLFVLDTLTVILLLGIIVAYNDAIRVFLQGTPMTTHSDALDAIVIACLIAPLSIVPDMGYLTKTSAAGLLVLAATLMVVALYGIQTASTSHNYHDTSAAGTVAYSVVSSPSWQWFPTNGLSGISQWFGCCVFGFGIVPLTFNFRESMAEPAKLPQATLAALLLVALTYILIGWGFLCLYPNIQADVLSELPHDGWIPILTRWAMVIVVMATSPLLIVPCGDIIEGKLLFHEDHDINHHNNNANHDYSSSHGHHHRKRQMMVRVGICILTVAISVGIPEFVSVLTLVGCFCVAFVSFCIPPYLHLLILKQQGKQSWTDLLLLFLGLLATGISTTYVFQHTLKGKA